MHGFVPIKWVQLYVTNAGFQVQGKRQDEGAKLPLI
jgi:hypothetical protein